MPQPAYFVDHKRGEVNELRGLLRNPKVMRDQNRQREVTKKVIAYMTLGIDVSKLFSEMIMASHTKDLVIKKMIYLYLCNYAKIKKDLAVLAINTLRKDAQDDDPMIRGLALRSLCSLNIPSIVEYVVPLLRSGVKDSSSYVRKTAAIGCARLFRISPETYKAGGWSEALLGMLGDRDAAVVINVLNTLNEVEQENGGLKAEGKLVLPLLQRIKEFNEWGQCTILELASRYQPANQQQMFGIMNHLDPLLKHSNCAVVLATTKVYLNFTRNVPKVHFSVISRLKVPLLTLMSSSSVELSYTVLSHLRVLVSRAPTIFHQDHKHFYCRYNDPTCIKKLKQDVLVDLANEPNCSMLINELSEYITDVDPEIAKQAIQSIAKISLKVEAAVDEGIELLLSFLDLSTDYVTAETCVVLKDILRRFPDRYEDVIPSLQTCLKSVEAPEGRVAVIWLMGEYGDTIDDAPYILEQLIDNYQDEESSLVRSELLTATMKLFFKRPPELQKMLGRLLKHAIDDRSMVDVRDQALFYFRLLRHDVHEAARVVNCEKVKVSSFAEADDEELKDQIFDEFNTLSVIYEAPSSRFCTFRPPEVKDPGDSPAATPHNPTAQAAATVAVTPSGGLSGAAAPAPSVGTAGREAKQPPLQVLEEPMEVKKSSPASSASRPVPAAAIDFLSNLADEPAAGAGSAPAPVLVARPKLAGAAYKKKWGALPKAGVHQAQLKTPLPPVKGVEAAFKQNSIAAVASGKKGGLMKFYFYAQSAKDSTFFLVEANLQIATGKFSATIKCENKSLMQDFEGEIKKVLSMLS
uniref:Beta-adaptin appendage C-terminal subdomain domain-containing protein n=2 Tax=Lotharella globosa TaxID=91324 RepID=A0A6U3AKM9_9EUKA|mmetsp:Transcript_25634/g.49907  ORF Transcript_25634/g.49907 Transcript_25634/m.49907 type:complete len:805 (+) Transcript_25634:26-2440(+)